MNPERLLQHFDRIAEAPHAIPRLRRFILDLAVRGKLVEQNPNDEPVGELLKRIQVEKEKLRREGLITGDKPSLTVLSTELPFSIPSSWQCTRFIDYARDISTGPFGSILHQSDYVKGGVPLVNPSHMVNGRIVPEQSVTVSCETGKRLSAYKLHAGDIVMARRGEVGRAAVVYGKEDGWLCGTGSFFLRFAEEVCREYLMVLLRCEFVRKYLAGEAVGITMVNLNHGILKRMPLPIPPLAEQRRIVAKVDELMALCDQLEAAKTEREQRRDRLVAASLHYLNQPADVEEANTPTAFRDHARFIFQHLPHLTTRPEHIKQLRQTILNLAVRGKLVPQDPNDEPASELLKRIEAEKTRLVKEGKIKRQDVLSSVTEDDLPFTAPDSWVWERLANVSRKIHYGFTASANATIKAVRLLRITDIQDNSVNWDSVPGCEIAGEQIDQFKLEAGDILIARTGGTIGKSFLVSEIPVTAVFASYLIRIQGATILYDRYLKLFVESPVYWKQLEDGTRGAGQPNVNGQTLGRMAVPLPPLAEQHRIVAKVDELMALCDQLEAQLTTTEADSRRLLEAVLHEALAQD